MAKAQNNQDQTLHYVPPRKKRHRAAPRVQPPLTPMIDVTFQLLIFFLVTWTPQSEAGIPGTLPQGQSITVSQAPPLEPIRIVIRPTDRALIGAEFEMSGLNFAITSPKELYDRLAERQIAVGDEVPVLLSPRADVRWGHVVDAYNQAVRAKYKNIGFAATGG